MSQLEDINAIHNMFVRSAKPANATSAALRTSWMNWWNTLRPYDKSSSPGTYKEAVQRRDAFFKAEEAGPTKTPVNTAPSKPGSSVVAVPPGPQPTIRRGSSGDAVKLWQQVIGVTADGKFGPGTEASTKTWQKSRGLTADGVVGTNTWNRARTESSAAMTKPTSVAQAATQAAQQVTAAVAKPAPMAAVGRPTIRRGSTGEYVKQWQRIIAVKDDGIFGSGTEASTKAWQKARGLTADGIVGANTWARAQIESGRPLSPAQVTQAVATQVAQAVSKPPAQQAAPKPKPQTQTVVNPEPRPSVVESTKQYISNATPTAVKETVTAVTGQLASLHASTPVWVKAMGVASGALAALIGFKVLGSGKKRAA